MNLLEKIEIFIKAHDKKNQTCFHNFFTEEVISACTGLEAYGMAGVLLKKIQSEFTEKTEQLKIEALLHEIQRAFND